MDGVYVRRVTAGKDGDAHLNFSKDDHIEGGSKPSTHARLLFAIINKVFPDCAPV